MKYLVDEEIIEKSTNCRNNLICLSDEGQSFCRLVFKGTGEICIVECLEGRDCGYLLVFGRTRVCKCPVRNEIAKKYGE